MEYLAETVEVLAWVIPPVTVVVAALLYIKYLAETVEVLAEVIPPVTVVVAALLYIVYLAETVEVLAEVIPPVTVVVATLLYIEYLAETIEVLAETSMTGVLCMLITFICFVEIAFKYPALLPRKMLFSRCSLKTSPAPCER